MPVIIPVHEGTIMEVPVEQVIIDFNETKKTATISTGILRMVEMSDDTICNCDLCNVEIGMLKDIKHSYSPEKVTKAVLNGLKPEKVLKEQIEFLKSHGINEPEAIEALYEGWKELSINSETEWAFCDGCAKEVERFLK